MIRRTVFALGILLGLSVPQSQKRIADRFGRPQGRRPRLLWQRNCPNSQRRPTGAGRHALWKRLLPRDGLPPFPGKFHARALPWRKGNYLGRTFSKKRLFKYPGGQNLSHARTGRHHRRNRWRRRTGMLVGQIQHARQRGSYPGKLRLPEP